MKKRVVSIVLAVSMVFVLAACGSETADTSPEDASEENGSEEEPSDENEADGWPEGGEVGTIDVDGGEVYYHLYGKDQAGTPLIFIHGGPGGNGACFFKQTALAEDRPVLIYNQLGSSGSSISEEYATAEEAQELLTIEHFVEELDTVIKHFEFDKFILVGRSWGTMLAVEYAAAKQPDGLKGIILNGPFLNVDQWIDDAERLIKTLPDGEAMWETILECESTGEYTEEYNEINTIYSENFNSRIEGAFDGTPSEPEGREIEGFSVYNYMWGPSEFSCTGTLQGHDSTKLLKDITVPILYISGEYDSGSPEAAFYYNSMTPNGEVCVLPGSAHNSSRERPEEFNAVVKAFAERVDN